MELVFGGKYQGQLEYALEKYELNQEDVFFCDAECAFAKGLSEEAFAEIDYSKTVIADFHNFVWGCVLRGVEAQDVIDWNVLEDKIVICDEVTSGLVPMDPEEREYREMLGRTMMALGQKAEHVTRVFCGIGQELK